VTDTKEKDVTALPKGLAETIDGFKRGCDSKNHPVAEEVRDRIIQRFTKAFKNNEGTWDDVASQITTLARLAGRAATLYADLDQKLTVQWVHARFALRDAQAECTAMRAEAAPVFGKHCQGVDLDTP
jgi:hypothetical protein